MCSALTRLCDRYHLDRAFRTHGGSASYNQLFSWFLAWDVTSVGSQLVIRTLYLGRRFADGSMNVVVWFEGY